MLQAGVCSQCPKAARHAIAAATALFNAVDSSVGRRSFAAATFALIDGGSSYPPLRASMMAMVWAPAPRLRVLSGRRRNGPSCWQNAPARPLTSASIRGEGDHDAGDGEQRGLQAQHEVAVLRVGAQPRDAVREEGQHDHEARQEARPERKQRPVGKDVEPADYYRKRRLPVLTRVLRSRVSAPARSGWRP